MCLIYFLRPQVKYLTCIPFRWQSFHSFPVFIEYVTRLNGSSLLLHFRVIHCTYKISPIPSSGWLKVAERLRFTVNGHSLVCTSKTPDGPGQNKVWPGLWGGMVTRGKHLHDENRKLKWSGANICWLKGGCDHTISPHLNSSRPESSPFSWEGNFQPKRNWGVKWSLQWCLS